MGSTLKVLQRGCPAVLGWLQEPVPALALFQAPGTVPALAPSSARACVTVLPLSWLKSSCHGQGSLVWQSRGQ